MKINYLQLAATLILDFTLIPTYSFLTAGVTTSIVYLLGVICQTIVFIKILKTKVIDLAAYYNIKSEFKIFRIKQSIIFLLN